MIQTSVADTENVFKDNIYELYLMFFVNGR